MKAVWMVTDRRITVSFMWKNILHGIKYNFSKDKGSCCVPVSCTLSHVPKTEITCSIITVKAKTAQFKRCKQTRKKRNDVFW